MTTEKVLRVNQLDATELDEELTEILQQQFINLFRSVPSLSWTARIKPELRAVVRLLIWTWSVQRTGSTFGQAMMQLRYSQTTDRDAPLPMRQKWLLLAAMVGGEWLLDRLEEGLPILLWTTLHSERMLVFVKSILQTANLLNFCLFLLKGEFPTLKDRSFSLSMLPTKRQTLRRLSYDLMNREIIWYGFGEFLFFILPHLNLFAIKNLINRVILPQTGIHATPSLANQQTCVVCKSLPIMPHVSNCGHLYCYYCIAANVAMDVRYPCSICGQLVAPYNNAISF